MSSVPPKNAEIVVVRETLEGVLSHEVAVRVMFEALHTSRSVPESPDEVLAFVNGPLKEVLSQQIGPDERDAVVERLTEVLGGLSGEPLELDIAIEEGSVTRAMPTAYKEPVSVLVVAGSDRFADCLRLSLGRTAPVTLRIVHDEASLRHDVFAKFPLLLVVDASDPAAIAPEVLMQALRTLPSHMVTVVWGAEHPFGRELTALLDEAMPSVVLREGEGIEPLLDVLLSRHQV